MKNQLPAWQKLTAAARQHRDLRDESAPYGFASRVASRACSVPASGSWSLLEKFAIRGLLAACTLGLAATAYGFVGSGTDDTEFAAGDVVGELLDLT